MTIKKKLTKAMLGLATFSTLAVPVSAVYADDQSELNAVNAQSVTVAQELTTLNDKINSANKQIVALQADISARQNQLDLEARDAQTNPESSNIVNVILSAKSLTDLVEKVSAMSAIVSANSTTLNTQEQQEQKFQSVLAQNETSANELQDLQSQLSSKKITLQTEITAQQQAALEKANEVKALQTQVQAAQAAAAAKKAAAAKVSSTPVAQNPVTVAPKTTTTKTTTSTSTTTSSTSSTPTTSATAPANPSGAAIAAYARQFVGDSYVWGAAGPTSFDCSGLVMYVYAHFGISLPHYSYTEANYGTVIPVSAAQPGDLIIEDGGAHVAIYEGGGMQVAAADPASGVLYQPLWSADYAVRIVG